jgi:hypothetical protein
MTDLGDISARSQDAKPQTEWVLARARTMSAGLRLVQFEIDEIGISLKNGWITPEHAAHDLAAIEQVPCMVAAIFYRGADE